MKSENASRFVRNRLARACLGTVLFGIHCAHGQDAEPSLSTTSAADAVDLEVFQAPRIKERSLPEYPAYERASNREGWVELNFMIDPAGKAYEIAVTESSGNEAFERQAVKAIEQTAFTPATLEGKPVDASYAIKWTFRLTGPGAGASSKFMRNFKALREAVGKGDKAAADAGLANLKGENLYELAYAAAAKYEYYLKWGTEAEQLEALEQAIAYETTPNYLPKALFNALLQAILPLQLLKQDFGAAAETWKTMQENKIDPAVLARFKPVMDDVAKLRTDDRSFAVEGEIGPNRPLWFTLLHKKKFHVDVSSGKIAEVKLRCDKKYVFFHFDPEIEYRIADEYGSCSLELVGDPGTKFKLQQS